MPAAARASARRHELAVGVAHLALAHRGERAVRERREVAGAAERAVLAHDRRDAGVEHGGVGLDDDAAHAGAAGHERRQAQQHEGAHDLALDLGARCRRRASGRGSPAAGRGGRRR